MERRFCCALAVGRMNWACDFFVPGVPQPKGNHRASRAGRIYDACKGLKSWQEAIGAAAMAHRPPTPIGKETAIGMRILLDMPRPKSLPKRVKHHTKRPDADKLLRAVLDALQGIFYQDDSQVIDPHPTKRYAEKTPGVHIQCWIIP